VKPPKPDLRVVAISVTQSGADLSLTDTTRNAGKAKARASATSYYLSSDAKRGAGDVRLAQRKVKALAARKRAAGKTKAKLPAAAPGSYLVLACADDGKKVREKSEANNCRASKGRITISAIGSPGGPGQNGVQPGGDNPAGNQPGGNQPGGNQPGGNQPGGNNPGGNNPGGETPKPDADRDGTPDAQDCAPNDPAVHPGAVDKPDASSTDANCDGIDGDESRSIFVAKTGEDTNPGTRQQPKRSIAAALTLAAQQDRDVLIANGQYAEILVVRSGVDVYGGYNADTWTRGGTGATTVEGTDTIHEAIGAIATDIDEPTTLQQLDIEPPDAQRGTNSYGLRAVRAPDLVLEGVNITAGNGGEGFHGPGGAHGTVGATGSNGKPGACTGAGERLGGDGAGDPGDAIRKGGKGGDGGAQGDNPGDPGQDAPSGAVGGAGGFADQEIGEEWGEVGQDGANGAAGAHGAGGDHGTLLGDGRFQLDSAESGGQGEPGRGGAGGGGGAGEGGSSAGAGNGGGGGGQGGTPGQGGSGAGGGGGSFGIVAVDSTGMTLRGSTVTARNGGVGGNGGAPGTGADGGPGGEGARVCATKVGAGGDGGKGGRGGDGGAGGGGAGGGSIALATRNATLIVDDTPLAHGSGGQGGTSAHAPASGPAGMAGPTWVAP
jgi:hypothetical protein